MAQLKAGGLFLLLLPLLFLFITSPETPGFEHPDTGFSVQFPATWKVVEGNEPVLVYGILPNEASVTIIHLADATGIDQKMIADYQQSLKRDLKGMVIMQQKAIVWNGSPAIRMDFKGMAKGRELGYRTYFLGGEGAFFQVSFSAQVPSFVYHVEAFDRIFKSIVIEPGTKQKPASP